MKFSLFEKIFLKLLVVTGAVFWIVGWICLFFLGAEFYDKHF